MKILPTLNPSMKFLFSLLLFILPLSVHADMYGQLGLNYNFFSQDIAGRDGSRPQARISLHSKEKFTDRLTLKLSPRYWYDGQAEAKNQHHFFDMEEAYIQFEKDAFTAKLGSVQLNWGVTDGFDPAAVIHSYVFWNPLELTALASPGLHMQWGWSDSHLELLVVPDKRSSMLPQQGSRWLPSEIIDEISLNNRVFLLPDQPNFYYLPGVERDKATQWNMGFRYYANLWGLETGLFFFDGAAPTPITGLVITPTQTATQPDGTELITIGNQIGIQPIDFRLQTTGATLVYNFESIILRYSGNYQHTVGRTSNPWMHSHVLGAEISWFSSGRYTTIFEHSMINRSGGGSGSLVTSISQLFDRSYMIAMRYELNDEWSSLISLLYDDIHNDKVYQATISGKLEDALRVELSWLDIVPGGPLTPLGSYNRNDRAQILFTYFF